MKKIALYTFILLATGLFSGCGEDFLDRERPLDFTESDIFSDASKVEGNVVSLYSTAGLRQTSLLGGRIFLISDNIGEDVVNVSGNGVELSDSYSMKVGLNTQENAGVWAAAYLTINKANTFLKSLEDNPEGAGTKVSQFTAEAKFCRALSYYYLHQLYTMPYIINQNALSVPLRLNAEADILNNDLERATSKQVIDQILADLADSNALPAGDGKEATVARASKGAAEALKMRIYMILGQWQDAINAGNNITGYSLVSNVENVFKAPYITSESIFSAAFADNNRGSGQSAIAYYYINGKSLVLSTATGSILSNADYNNPKDARIAGLTNIDASNRILLTKFLAYPYIDWVPVFRYAEILLNKAECYANLGNDAEALALLKQVRSRSIDPADDTVKLDGLTGDALKQAIYNEQRLEFIGEGHRAFNVFRRGETITKLGATFGPSQGTTGYIWAVPNVERANNKAIVD